MLLDSLLRGVRDLRSRRRGPAGGRRCPSRPRSRRLACEPLEERQLLSFDPGWLVTLNTSPGQEGVWGRGVATDAQANVVAAGNFLGSVDFDPGPGVVNVTADANGTDQFVAKYAADRTLAWVRSFGANTGNSFVRTAVDAEGSVYVAAGFAGTVDFDLTGSHPGNVDILTSTNGYDDVYVLKLDSSGNFVWVAKGTGSVSDRARELALDGRGGLYILGYSNSADLRFGANVLPTGNGGAFLAKVDSASGNFLWGERFGGTYVEAMAIAVDDNGALYVSGDFSGTGQFGTDATGSPITLTSRGDYDAFIARFAPDGTPIWADGLGGSAREFAYGLAVDGEGNVFAAGSVYSSTTSVDFYRNTGTGGQTGLITVQGSQDVFVLKVAAADGSLEGSQRIGGSGSDSGARIAVDPSAGIAYVVGNFEGTVSFGSQTLVSAGGKDGFLSALRTGDLGVVNSWRFGGTGGELPLDLTLDSSGLVFATGYFQNTADFPTGDVGTSATACAGFLMKFNPNAATVSGHAFADLNADGINNDGAATPQACTVFLDANGNGVLDPGESSTTNSGPQGTYKFAGLEPGTYTVVEVAQSGWTPTTPVSQTVTVGAGQAAAVDFGNSLPWTTSSYTKNAGTKIPDLSSITSSLVVSDSYPIMDLNVTVTIAHPDIYQLSLTLVAPDGTEVVLLNAFSVTHGNANLTNTVFDDESANLIYSGSGPYTGTFKPYQPLEAVDRKTMAGTWKLKVTDNTKGKTGTLKSWGLAAIHETTQGNAPKAGANVSASLTDAALRSLVLCDIESPSKPAPGKGLAMIPAVDLALLDLAI